MRIAVISLCVLAALAGVRADDTFSDFIATNPLYKFISEGVPELLSADDDVGYTIFIPMLNNVSAPQAAAFPQLSPNLVLPKVYKTAKEFIAAGAVQNLANGTIALEDDPGAGVVNLTFEALGGATAQLVPIAFPLGKSVLFPITVVNSGDVPEQVGAEAPAPGY